LKKPPNYVIEITDMAQILAERFSFFLRKPNSLQPASYQIKSLFEVIL